MTSGHITRLVPDAYVGQLVEVDGTSYRVIEINLARPHHPVLAPAE